MLLFFYVSSWNLTCCGHNVQKRRFRRKEKVGIVYKKFSQLTMCCNFLLHICNAIYKANVHLNGHCCKNNPWCSHERDYLHYIFVFPQFPPNWTLRRSPCVMPAYCLFPRVQHHLHGSGKAASLWCRQMGQGHSLLERCAAPLQVQFAIEALWPVCKVIYEIQYKWIGESKSCKSVQKWRMEGSTL